MIFRLFPGGGEWKKRSTLSLLQAWPTGQQHGDPLGVCYKGRIPGPTPELLPQNSHLNEMLGDIAHSGLEAV